MRIFAFRSFRAAAPGLMEFTQQQRCLFICSARPASPSISICFSGQGFSFSSINMHSVECSGTRAQSAGWSIRIVLHICTPACKEHLLKLLFPQGRRGFMNRSENGMHMILYLDPITCVWTPDCFGITSREVYLRCSSKTWILKGISLDVSRILMTQPWKAEMGSSFVLAEQKSAVPTTSPKQLLPQEGTGSSIVITWLVMQ